jgi:SNF2 family DNA or RNA helicase
MGRGSSLRVLAGRALRREQTIIGEAALAPSLRIRYKRVGERYYVRIVEDVPNESRVWQTLQRMGAPLEVDKDPRALSWSRFVREGGLARLQKAASMLRATLEPEPGEAPLASAGRLGKAYREERPVDVDALLQLAKQDDQHALATLRAGRTELAVWAKDKPEYAPDSKKDLAALDAALDSLKLKAIDAAKERDRERARQLSIALKGLDAGDVWKAKAELEQLRDRAERTSAETPRADVPLRIPRFRGKLRPYQQEGVEFLVARDLDAILADEMGLGKTIMTIAAVLAKDARAMVVGPANVLYNWADEIDRFTDEVPLVYHERKLFGNERSRFLVTTYDALRSLDPQHEQVRSRDVLVLDEAHYIRNPETQRSQLVKALPQKRRLLLTGTPLVNGLEDYYELLEQVEPSRFASRTQFRDEWIVDPALFAKYAAVRNVAAEYLHRATRDVLLRRRKDDVLKELPARTITVTRHELSPADARAYAQVEAKALEAIRERKSDVAVFAALHAMRHQLAVARVPAVLERVRELLEAGEAVVVYSHYLEPLQKLQEALGDAAATLDGSTPPKRRKEIADQLGREGGPRVVLAQMEAGGVGLNFTGARYVLFVHFGWTPAVHAQAMDRVHRIGQDRAVFVEFFVTPGTIDERIVRILLRKEADQNLVLAEGTDLLNRAEIEKLFAEGREADKVARDDASADALLRRLAGER